MNEPRHYQFDLPSDGGHDDVQLAEVWYPGIQRYWEGASSRRIFDPILGVRAVIIHATAGGSSEGAVSVIRARRASFHWLVPDEDEPQHGRFVWACIPEARAAWHVRNACRHPAVNGGADKANHWSLGIEVVNRQDGGDAFSEWQLEATAQIVRYCRAKYPNLRHVVSHARLDPSRRTDPGRHFDWDRFRQRVLEDSRDVLPETFDLATRAADVDPLAHAGGCCP